LLQLKSAKQLTRKEFEEVVDIDKRVTVKNLDSDLEETYVLLLQIKKEETKQNLYYLGWDLLLVGWKVGDVINWNFEEGENNWKSWPLKDAVRNK
jgi:regulator of nucleoside diphosphate kinase